MDRLRRLAAHLLQPEDMSPSLERAAPHQTLPALSLGVCSGAVADSSARADDAYVPPRIWTEEGVQENRFSGLNRPTAGARGDRTLPVGTHALQLYSLGTPNGQKVTILLEELNETLGIEYDAWIVNIMSGDQFGSGFVALNPNSKIPALLDREAGASQGGTRVFESGAILIYLAEKYGRFLPTEPRTRAECFSWLMWQVGSAPLIGGGFGHFYAYAPTKWKYPIDRYAMEVKRLLDVADRHLAENQYFCGSEYTIADMAIFPWLRTLCRGGYKAGDVGCDTFLQTSTYRHVARWLALLEERPAVRRGLRVNRPGGTGAVRERHSRQDFDEPGASA
eukprot:TRINITY_DN58184_c0_g1_i1.p1 TRINITY_DN58184_c0_g1~~TRINITY_DN58184_c0_g1_i1.p1  ORF type:complete len:336 (+),score=71.08 TRINITY_DN58184_c0_g1_i1:137-1144(+)